MSGRHDRRLTAIKPARRVAIDALILCLIAMGCTPQAALLGSLLPAGTFNTLLGNLETVSDANRSQVVELGRLGRWEELGRFADKNLEKDPRNADWWLIAGYARTQLQQHRQAAEAYMQAVRFAPDADTGWHMLAESYRAEGDTRRAIDTLNNALLAMRNSPVTFFLLGESYSDIGHFSEAATAYSQALSMAPRFAAAWFGLARAYAQSGRVSEASAARAQLEKLDPELARRLEHAGVTVNR